MKNWKTTFFGAILAALTFIATYQENGGKLDDWKLWIIPAAIAAFGFVAKDLNVTGGSVKVLAVLLLPLFVLTSCGMSPREMLAVGLGTGWKALPIAKAEYDAVLGARVKAEAESPKPASGGKITRLVQP